MWEQPGRRGVRVIALPNRELFSWVGVGKERSDGHIPCFLKIKQFVVFTLKCRNTRIYITFNIFCLTFAHIVFFTSG